MAMTRATETALRMRAAVKTEDRGSMDEGASESV